MTASGLGLGPPTTLGVEVPQRLVRRVLVRARADPGSDLFVGVAPTGGVEDYLAGVGRCRVLDVVDGRATCDAVPGSAPPRPPVAAGIWWAAADGDSPEMTSALPHGGWTVVVMNADGSADVAAEVTIAADVPGLPWAGWSLVVTGLGTAVGAMGLGRLAAVVRRERERGARRARGLLVTRRSSSPARRRGTAPVREPSRPSPPRSDPSPAHTDAPSWSDPPAPAPSPVRQRGATR